MFVKNLAECLITINAPHVVQYDKTDKNGKPKDDSKIVDVQQGKSFQLLPAGPAVEIPDEFVNIEVVSRQLENYIKAGDIQEVSQNQTVNAKADDTATGDFSEMSREDLEGMAAAFGIEFDDNTKTLDLIKAIRAKS